LSLKSSRARRACRPSAYGLCSRGKRP
jgi:hypothetical protein